MDELKAPRIEIKFGTCNETNEQIFSVYVKTITDAVNAARGDVAALEKLHRLGKELAWITDGLIYELKRETASEID